MTDYTEFLASKRFVAPAAGFEPVALSYWESALRNLRTAEHLGQRDMFAEAAS